MTQRKGQALIKRISQQSLVSLLTMKFLRSPEHLLYLLKDKLYVVFEIDDSMSGCTIAPMLIEQGSRKGKQKEHLPTKRKQKSRQ